MRIQFLAEIPDFGWDENFHFFPSLTPPIVCFPTIKQFASFNHSPSWTFFRSYRFFPPRHMFHTLGSACTNREKNETVQLSFKVNKRSSSNFSCFCCYNVSGKHTARRFQLHESSTSSFEQQRQTLRETKTRSWKSINNWKRMTAYWVTKRCCWVK